MHMHLFCLIVGISKIATKFADSSPHLCCTLRRISALLSAAPLQNSLQYSSPHLGSTLCSTLLQLFLQYSIHHHGRCWHGVVLQIFFGIIMQLSGILRANYSVTLSYALCDWDLWCRLFSKEKFVFCYLVGKNVPEKVHFWQTHLCVIFTRNIFRIFSQKSHQCTHNKETYTTVCS